MVDGDMAAGLACTHDGAFIDSDGAVRSLELGALDKPTVRVREQLVRLERVDGVRCLHSQFALPKRDASGVCMPDWARRRVGTVLVNGVQKLLFVTTVGLIADLTHDVMEICLCALDLARRKGGGTRRRQEAATSTRSSWPCLVTCSCKGATSGSTPLRA